MHLYASLYKSPILTVSPGEVWGAHDVAFSSDIIFCRIYYKRFRFDIVYILHCAPLLLSTFPLERVEEAGRPCPASLKEIKKPPGTSPALDSTQRVH